MGEASSFCGSALPLTPPPLFLIYSVLPVIGADGFIEIFTLLEVGLAFVNLFFAYSPVSHPFAPARHTQTCFTSPASFLLTLLPLTGSVRSSFLLLDETYL